MIHSNQLMSLKKCGIVNRETDKVNEYCLNIPTTLLSALIKNKEN